MEIKRSGLQSSTKGPADYFTGTVRIDPLFQVKDPARTAGNSVTLSGVEVIKLFRITSRQRPRIYNLL